MNFTAVSAWLHRRSLPQLILVSVAWLLAASLFCGLLTQLSTLGIDLDLLAAGLWLGALFAGSDYFARCSRWFLCLPLTEAACGILFSLVLISSIKTGLFPGLGLSGSDLDRLLGLVAITVSGALMFALAAVSLFCTLVLFALSVLFAVHGRHQYKQTDWPEETPDQNYERMDMK